jgi:hypothetical protein
MSISFQSCHRLAMLGITPCEQIVAAQKKDILARC